MILTAHYDTIDGLKQADILLAIHKLYCPNGFECDVTYSRGMFYKDTAFDPPLKFDLIPQALGVQQADCRDLPLIGGTINSLVCDLPFLHAPGKESVMGNRFSGFASQAELRLCYRDAMKEFSRVLAPKGVLVWKCQDIIESGKPNWTHCHLWSWAYEFKLRPVDLFVQVSERVMQGHNHGKQVHARKNHSFWWVFEKVSA